MEWVDEFLEGRRREGLLRELRPALRHLPGRILYEEREFINFSSNDYLGLARHPLLIESAKKAAEFGTSSSASRLLGGDLELHHLLEEEVARFKSKEKALLFSTGYQANVGVISALVGREDAVFSDELNHASIIDGVILSRAARFIFRHNDVGHLEELLRKERAKFRRALVVTEGVFSMEGDRAPLREIASLKERYDFILLVDEAHATGIFGERGSGVVEEEGVEEEVDIIMGTFGKALGSFGAYIASSEKLISYLVNTARSFIFTTALPPPVVGANLAALKVIREEPWRRKKLLENASFFRRKLEEAGFETRGCTQIVPLILGEAERAVRASRSLMERGIFVLPARPPTVPPGESRLRFSLSCDHTREDLLRVVECLIEISEPSPSR